MAPAIHDIELSVIKSKIHYNGLPHHRVFVDHNDTIRWLYPGPLSIHFVGISPLNCPLIQPSASPLTATVAPDSRPGLYKYFVALLYMGEGEVPRILTDDPDVIVNPGGGTGK